MKFSNLLVTTEKGNLCKINLNKNLNKCLFSANNGFGLMGLDINKDNIYLQGNTTTFILNKKDFKIKRKKKFADHGFHQLRVYNNFIYTTSTKTNEIYKLNKNLDIIKKIKISPPNKGGPVEYKINYNHINHIFKYNDNFYISLNWLTEKQYGPSGVCILNKKYKEIDRFEFGWEIHNFEIIDKDRVCVLGTSGTLKAINHPHIGGIMINKKVVFKHDPDESFCKALCYDNKFFYLCGGEKVEREKRKSGFAVIYVIDRSTYSLVKKFILKDVANIKGALIYE